MPSVIARVQKLNWGEIEWLWLPTRPVGSHMAVSSIHLASGISIPAHCHLGEEQFLVVISGRGEHRVDNVSQPLRPGDVRHIGPDSNHHMICTSDEALKFLVFARAVPSKRLSSRPAAGLSLDDLFRLFSGQTDLAAGLVSREGYWLETNQEWPAACKAVCRGSRGHLACQETLRRVAEKVLRSGQPMSVRCCLPGTASVILPAQGRLLRDRAVICGPMLVQNPADGELEAFAESLDLKPGGVRELVSTLSSAPLYRLWTAATALYSATGGDPTAPATMGTDGAWAGAGAAVPGSPKFDRNETEILVAALERLVHTAPAAELTLEAISHHLGLSPSYLSRRFPAWVGQSFRNYMRDVKIDRACRLLATSDHPIHRVAFLCGYYDLAHFEKVFKQLTGMPPSRYRTLSRVGAVSEPWRPGPSPGSSPTRGN